MQIARIRHPKTEGEGFEPSTFVMAKNVCGMPHREIEHARQKELGEREGYTVEPAPGGRYRVTATATFGKPRDAS